MQRPFSNGINPVAKFNSGLAVSITTHDAATIPYPARHDFQAFSNNKTLVVRNPFFGDLNYDLWIALLYKHGKHHLRQFGIQEIDNS